MDTLEKMKLIYEKELTFDEPIKYECSQGVLDIYPIMMKNYVDFNLCSGCLLLDQYNDEEAKDNLAIYQMSYMEYLLDRASRHPEELLNTQITKLLSLCFNIDFFEGDNQIMVYQGEKNHVLMGFDIDDYSVRISSKDFDNIKQIICLQNDIDLTLFTLDPRVRIELNKTLRLKNKEGEDGSLEDKIISLSLVTGFTLDEINKLSIKKFRRFLERANLLMNYKMGTQAMYSGFVQFDESSKPPHWLSKIDNDVTKNVTDYDKFANANGIAKV